MNLRYAIVFAFLAPMFAVAQTPCDLLEPGFMYSGTGDGLLFSNGTTGTGFQTTFFWTFGDGGESTEAQPFHIYVGQGTFEVCLTVTSLYETGGGEVMTCVETICQPVVAGSGDPCDFLEACFEVDQVNSTSFLFINCTPNESGTQYLWNFGDGSINDGMNATHVFTPGTYTVCMTATWENCVDSTCITITAGGVSPCSQFIATYQMSPGDGSTINFTGSASSPDANFIWYFPQGVMLEGAEVSHTYPEPGTYYTCMSAWYWNELAQDTCWTESCQYVHVVGMDPCDDIISCFEYEAQGNGVFEFFSGCSVAPDGATYTWSFGDGSYSADQQPDHQYSIPGTYNVCLQLSWADCFSNSCTTIIVEGNAECDPNFAVTMDWNDNGNQNMLFVADPNMDADGILWFFGNGDVGYGNTVEYQYDLPGQYNVCVAAWYWNELAQDSCWADACQLVTVGGVDQCDFLVACFVPSQLGSTSFFFNNCTPNESGTEYLWDFGDGATSDDLAPMYTYTAPGTYNVCLTATWQDCVDSTCITVIAGEPASCAGFEAGFAWNNVNGNGVIFTGTTNIPADGMIWYFGDGDTGSGNVADHQYDEAGEYNVCLAAWYWNEGTQDTCWAEACEWILVGDVQQCSENFTVEIAMINNGEGDIVFTAVPNMVVSGVLWYFGDGATGFGNTVEHEYDVLSEEYQVCVATWYWDEGAQDSCWAEACQWIVPLTVGIADEQADHGALLVYPVPAQDMVVIDGPFDRGANTLIELYSADGRLLKKLVPTHWPLHLDISDLPAGIHMIRMVNGDRIHQARMVKS